MSQIYPELVGDAVEAGVKWIGKDIFWDQVEPAQDVWDWSAVDSAYFGFCVPNDFWQVITIRTGQGWAVDTSVIDSLGPRLPHADCPPRDYSDYYDLVHHLVSHLIGTDNVFQIGVEPDIINRWYGTGAQYLQLKETAYAAAKAADPEATVLAYQLTSGGLGICVARDIYEHGDVIGAMDFFNAFFSRVSRDTVGSRRELLEAIYTGPNDRKGDLVEEFLRSPGSCDGVSINYGAPHTCLEATVDWVNQEMDSFGGRKPLWVLEVGIFDRFDLVNTADAALELVKMHSLFFSKGIERMKWYPLTVDTARSPIDWDREPLIYYPTRERLPAYYSYQLLATRISSLYEFAQRAQAGDSSWIRCLFRNRETGLLDLEVAWADRETVAVTIVPPVPCDFGFPVDHQGCELDRIWVVFNRATLRLTPEPVLIHWAQDNSHLSSARPQRSKARRD
jgi:hypothetical protein